MTSARVDGRGAKQLRPVKLTAGYLKYAEGSTLIEVGDTRVLCAASVDERTPFWLRETNRDRTQKQGWITGEYGMLPRATDTRTQREVSRGRPSGRTHEIQRIIGRSLRAVTDLTRLGERTVWIDCDVLQADGGTRTAAISGAFVALAMALDGLMEKGKITQPPLHGQVAATSVGIVDGERILDLCYEEDSRAEVDMNVVMTGGGRLIEVQGTAEGSPFGRPELESLLDLAAVGVEGLFAEQKKVLEGSLARLLAPAAPASR